MSHSPLLNDLILKLLPEDLHGVVILDVACGYGDWGFLMRTRKNDAPYLVGIDIWSHHLKRLSALRVYDQLVRVCIPYLPFREKSFDICLACEILEHLSKSASRQLLRELERITKRIIIVSTPLDWPQGEIYSNPYERHVSEWKPQELTKYGYEAKVVDAVPLPRTLKVIDKVRRAILRLPRPKLVMAYKRLTDSQRTLHKNSFPMHVHRS
jgi:ubiquinone/menaquinone biosynthesis C-methylase UbiE